MSNVRALWRKRAMVTFAVYLMQAEALAGWYEIHNYTGNIGTLPVHVSLQNYAYVSESREWRIEGSYYYDRHRIPIPLLGTVAPSGEMTLCEAEAPNRPYDGARVPHPSKAHPNSCPLALTQTAEGVGGLWDDGRHRLPVTLKQIGSLDNRHNDQLQLGGVVEIPMWFHPRGGMLVGIYTDEPDCGITMSHVRLVSVDNGSTVGEWPLECGAGMLMTTVYENVARAAKSGQVVVEFVGGKMGYEELLDLNTDKVTK